MKELTKVEEEVMHIIWRLKRCVVRDVISELPLPHPPYSTISSVVRILEKKGFVNHKAYGKTHEYFPVIEQNVYKKHVLQNVLSKYFSGSVSNLFSFFAKENELSIKDLTELIAQIDLSQNEPPPNED